MTTNPRFTKSFEGDFYSVLKKRVDDYLLQNKINKKLTFAFFFKALIIQTVLFLFIYAISFLNISFSLSLVFWAALGFVMASLFMATGHDVTHGVIFSGSVWNKVLEFFIACEVGVNVHQWKIQHNIYHHTFTNLNEWDLDISKDPYFVLSPNQKAKAFHKFQHIYAPFLYSLLMIKWSLTDLDAIINGVGKQRILLTRLDVVSFIFSKIFHVVLFFVIPIVFSNLAWWQILFGYIFMGMVQSLFLSIIFQLAHVNDKVDFPILNSQQNVENLWVNHEMATTANFAVKNKILFHIVGGLNFQVEHHLFPHITHIHYPKINQILVETAKEFNISYHEFSSFLSGLKAHFRALKKFGNPQSTIS